MLNDTERELLIYFLDDLIGRFSNAGCNDFTMKDTPENRVLIETAHKTVFADDSDFDIEDCIYRGKLMCFDWMLVEYLKSKFEDTE